MPSIGLMRSNERNCVFRSGEAKMAGRLIDDRLIYLLADKRFREPITKYRPDEKDFYLPIRKMLPSDWTLDRHQMWWNCAPRDHVVPQQGWKIHISAIPMHAGPVLATVGRILFARGVAFKFVVDRSMLIMINGKQWGRGSGGKFITIYPTSTAQCAALLEDMRIATVGFAGPYILSDRRYKDSKVVYYRYGGLLSLTRMNEEGKFAYLIKDCDGEYVDDERNPYFSLPKGIEDPFQAVEDSVASDESEAGTLKFGRYKIRNHLTMTNSGGVYLAVDRETGADVVIKEARPGTNVSVFGLDAVQLLKKEHRILSFIEAFGFSPKPVDFFMDWEHAYLVEEYLENAVTLQSHMTKHSLLLCTRPSIEDTRKMHELYREIFSEIALALSKMHEIGVVFSDLSYNNIMLREADRGYDIKIIDFEGAYQEGIDMPTHLHTPGFTAESVVRRGWSKKEDDYYAFGSLLLSGVMPIGNLVALDRTAYRRFLDAVKRDYGFPESIADLIDALLSEGGAQTVALEEAARILSAEYPVSSPNVGDTRVDREEIANIVDDIAAYIELSAEHSREDRLYPADHGVYETNPLGIAYGACGIAYVLSRIRGVADPEAIGWIRSKRIDRSNYAPGLYSGLSGIAWSLLEIGESSKAMEVIDLASEHEFRWSSHDLFHGAAGWGMAQLRFHLQTGDESYLRRARAAGDHLIASAERDANTDGLFWSKDGDVSASFAHGAAGVALFLLYLHAATGDDAWLRAGSRALTWVSSQAIENPEGGLTWRPYSKSRIYTPYLRWGSSGIGRVFLRYWRVTGDPRYVEALQRIHIDCNHKYTIFPGYFSGIAGIGEFYLDLIRFPEWSEIAERATERILAGASLFAIREENGISFPGESLSRISCDYGTGGAGVAMVMHRYLTRCPSAFMLDDLLPATVWAG
ncbi:MAG: class III lanthionine synthetase LanKC [Lysobacter sp.]|nr:class III lanthionine synthetase LanKC [Lysobacter sp.]